ncbi:helix-turn-helix domain-containing protein [Rhodococcoides fascians]|uniref:helix-turn-helix domain-containing protein n=1 Tax=Rhodococcoides fascians TaxID=1828 RepID=UPI0009B8181B|nr:hypothetical protein [Rhodococcus fascians]WQH27810.1 hypothetical protein U2G91_22540 [Rhodococcus fascians]
MNEQPTALALAECYNRTPAVNRNWMIRTLGDGEFAERVGLTPASIAVLENGRAEAVRLSTRGTTGR